MTARTRNVMAAALVGAIATVTLGAGVARTQSAAEVAAANNPLAPITAINLQNYYVPTLYGSPDSTANSFLLRPVVATESMIIRATLPLSTISGNGADASGLGDLNIFDAFLLPRHGTTQFGVGPLFVFPTATSDALGVGVGKVLRAGHAVFNIFLEPQFTVVHYGAGQPAVQIFGGINIQFPKKSG